MFGSSIFTSYDIKCINDEILFLIVTNNLNKLIKTVNKDNVNNIIDRTNNYTALHYAIKQPNQEIVKYLLSIGANPNLKQKEGKDCYDLAIQCHHRFIFDYDKKLHENTLDKVYDKLDAANYKIRTLEDDKKYLNKSIDEYQVKVEKISKELCEKKKECIKIKRNLEETELAFSNLLKKQKK